MSTDELAVDLAAGLRQLADMIEQHPAVAEAVAYALRYLYVPQVTSDARTRLETVRAAGLDIGADVTVTNHPDRCEVLAEFGPVRLKLDATAGLMAGQQPHESPPYAPLRKTGPDTD
ncbi:hypothetical protein [Tamaricihabitans halophyticus]|nr:hypothetical protein [Tamaricihabitans halophyticus]